MMPAAAVAAIHAGAKEYIPLPPDAELIAAVLAAVAETRENWIYRDDAMARVVKLAQQIAPFEASRADHRGDAAPARRCWRATCIRSAPRREDFISRQLRRHPGAACSSPNCSATRRAPSPARSRAEIGNFEEANGGTLLLDEISEMDVRLQAKLLRAIQERDHRPRRRHRPVPIDIRIIATSNRNLAEAVREGAVPRGSAVPPQRR